MKFTFTGLQFNIERLEVEVELSASEHIPQAISGLTEYLSSSNTDNDSGKEFIAVIADNEVNRDNSFWSRYIGYKVNINSEFREEDTHFYSGFVLKDKNPFTGAKKERFEEV